MATDDTTLVTVPEPFPISRLSGRFLIFDINAITYIRREYNICGVFIGGLPQVPQQNIFLGVPLQLMPEEARILIQKGVAYLVDDAKVHTTALSHLSGLEAGAYLSDLQRQGREAALAAEKQAEEKKRKSLSRLEGRGMVIPQSQPAASSVTRVSEISDRFSDAGSAFFDRPEDQSTSQTSQAQAELCYAITPTTSYPLLPQRKLGDELPLPEVPASYPLFAHLHSKGYFMTPGLRFGCQYSVYPGDPLRFHSHFLAVGSGWDEEIDLLDLVGGGRLGTGVKKGYLIGGADLKARAATGLGEGGEDVRTFCIEWGGM